MDYESTVKRDRIMAIDKQLKKLNDEKESLTAELQVDCTHDVTVEQDYRKTMISTFPPRRKCLLCGLEEDGWGCGYKKLKAEPIKKVEDFSQFHSLQPLTKSIPVPANLFEKAA